MAYIQRHAIKWDKGSPPATCHPTFMEIGWVAGFLEGEGTFSVNHWKMGVGTGASSLVRATQKAIEPLKKLQTIVGGNITLRPNDGYYEWRAYGARARGIMFTLFSLLSARRKAQIVSALGGY